MKRTNPVLFAGALLGIVVLLGGPGLLKGGLYMDRYEGDGLHLIEIVLRMVRGEIPHEDFMTPIGLLAFWPIAVFVRDGFGFGMGFLMAQVAVALVLLPAVAWTGYSRFPRGLAWLYGFVTLLLPLVLVHGGSDPNISLSMHYNRWAWALAFVVLPLALLEPPGRRMQLLDGGLIGLALAALALLKVTYFVALAPGVVVVLLARGAGRTLATALLAGALAAGALTLALGVNYWLAYIGDLQQVAGSKMRAFPGRTLDKVLTAPLYLAGNMLGLLAVILLRQAGQSAMGLGLLCLLPGLVYVTYQNFGNDPQWLMVVALVLLASRPHRGLRNDRGWDLRAATLMTAVAMLGIVSASFLNMAYSPARHFTEPTESYTALFPRSRQHDDLFTESLRAFQVNMQVAGETVEGLERFAALAQRKEPSVLNGEVLPECTLTNGTVAWFDTVARDLESAGLAQDNRILSADLLSSLWMYSPQLVPLRHGAPWRYGGVPGLADATHVLVPLCAVNAGARADILQALADRKVPLTEVRRTPLYILLKKG